MTRLVAVVLALNLAVSQVSGGILANTWAGGSGNWNSPLNWLLQGVPNSQQTVNINSAGLITLDTDPTVFGLTFSAAGGIIVSDGTPRTLTVSDDFQWSSGQIGTNTTVVVRSQGAINNSVTLRGGHLRLEGQFDHNGGLLSALASTSNSVTVASGGTYDLQADTTVLSAGNDDVLLVDSGGTLRKASGTGTATIDWNLTNNGTLEVQAGTLNLAEGGHFNGVQTVASGAVLGLTGKDFSMGNGLSVGGAGTWSMGRPLDIGAGTVTADAVTVFPSFGILQGSGTFNAASNFTFSGGDLEGSVTFNVNRAASLTGSTQLEGNVLNVNGTLTHTAGTLSSASGFNPQVHVMNNALYDIRLDSTIVSGGSSDKFVIQGGGTLRKSSGTGTSTLDWGVTNLGLVDVQTGRLSFSEGGHLAGTYAVASGARLQLNSGNFSIADGVSIPGMGDWEIVAPVDLGAGTVAADIDTSFQAGGTLSGSGIFNANSNFLMSGGDVDGTLTLNLNHTATANGSTLLEDVVVNVHSSLVHSSSSISSVNGFNPVINVENGALLELRGAGTALSGGSSDKLVNKAGGVIRRTTDTGTATLDWAVTNLGAMEVQTGILALSEGGFLGGTYQVAGGAQLSLTGGDFDVANGVSLAGAGDLFVSRPLNLGSGTVASDIDMNFSAGALLQGSGVFNANSNLILSGGDLEDSVTLNLNHTVTANGSTQLKGNVVNVRSNFAHTAGTISAAIGFNPVINVDSGAVIDLRDAGTFLSGGSSDKLIVKAGGFLRRSVDPGTITVDWGLTNLGTIDVQTGILSFSAGGHFDGTQTVASGARMSLSGGSFTIASGRSFAGAGNLDWSQPLDIGSGVNATDVKVSFLSGGLLQGSGTLNVNSNINLSGGDLQDSVTMNLNHTATSSGSMSLQTNTVNVNGTLAHTGGTISSATGADPVFNVASGGLLDLQGAGTAFSGGSSDQVNVLPGGTLRRSVGTGTTTIDWGLTNRGLLEVQTGILALSAGAHLAGSYDIGSGTRLQLNGGNFTAENGVTLAGAGDIDLLRPLDLATATVNADVEVSAFSGAFLEGSGQFNANKHFRLGGGDLRGTVVLDLNNTATVNGSTSMEGNVVNVRSNLTHSSSLFSALTGFNPLVDVHGPAVYELTGSGTSFSGGSSDMLRIRSGATLRKNSSSTSTIDWGTTNLGTIEVVQGELAFAAGGHFGGAQTIDAGARLQLTGGDFTIANGVSVSGAGRWDISRPLELQGGTVNADARADFFSNAELRGSGVFNANSNVVLAGGDLHGTVTLNLNQSASQTSTTSMENNTINIRSNFVRSSAFFNALNGFNPRVHVAAGGRFDITGDGTVTSGDAADTLLVEPGGELIRSSGTGVATIDWGLTNQGTVRVASGSLSLNFGLTQTAGSLQLQGGSLTAGEDIRLDGGVLEGQGSVFVSGHTLRNLGGTVKPGDNLGTLSVSGGYEQGAGGTLSIDIGIDEVITGDQLDVNGPVTLGGNLAVNLLSGATPNAQDIFTIVSASSVSGSFANAPSRVTLADGSTFDVVVNASSVELRNFQPLSLVTNAGGTHNWSSTVGWLPQVLPASTIGATIANAGTISLDVSPTLPVLNLANASANINGSGTITAPFNWSAGGLGSSVIIAANGGTINGGGFMRHLVTVSGTMNHTSGAISSPINVNPVVQVLSNGVYDLQFDGTPFNGDTGDRVLVDPGGQLRKSTTAGTTEMNWRLANAGLVDVRSGRLDLNAGAELGGTLSVSNGAVAHWDLGSFVLLAGGQSAGAGEVLVSAGVTTPAAAEWTAGGPILLGAGTTIGGTGTLRLNGGGAIGDGVVLNTGSLDIRSTVHHTNGAVVSQINNSPDISVSSGGVLLYPDDTGNMSGDSGDDVIIRSGGVLRKSGGVNTVFNWGIRNSGRIEAQAGTIQFGSGGDLGGVIDLSSGAVVLLDGGTFTLTGSSTGDGTLRLSAVAFVSGEDDFTADSPVELVPTGSLQGSGEFNANRLFTFNGGELAGTDVNIRSNASVIAGTSFRGVLNVFGNVAHTAGTHTSVINQSPRINVRSNGVYDLRLDGRGFDGDTGDRIVVQPGGVLRRSTATNDARVRWFVENNGAVSVENGSLTFESGGELGGSSQVATNAVWHLDSGNYALLAGGQVSGPGALRVSTRIDSPAGGSFVANNPVELISGGNLNGTGVFAAAGGGAMGDGFVLVTGELELRSRVRHTNGFVSSSINQSPIIRVTSGGVLDYPDDSGTLNGDVSDRLIIATGGRLHKSGGTNLNTIHWRVENDGTIDIDGGGLVLNGGGNIAGNAALAAGGVLELGSGTFEMATNGVAAGAGTLVVSASARVPAGGVYTANSVVDLVNGGSIGGLPGTFVINGPFNIHGGQVIGSGRLRVNGTGTVTNGASFSGIMDVHGSLTHTSGRHSSIINQSPQLNIRSNGVYAIDMDAQAFEGDTSDTINVDAGGTLRKTGGAGEAIVRWKINNDGAIDVRSGMLSFTQTGVIGGSSTVNNGAVLHLDAGSFDLLDGGEVNGNGEFRVSTSFNVPSGNFDVNSPVRLGVGATLSGGGRVVLNGGGMVGEGYSIVSAVTDVRSRVFHTNGFVSSIVNQSPRFLVSSNGILEYPDDSGSFNGDASDTLEIAAHGILRKSGGTNTSIRWGIDNSGLIDVRSGRLHFTQGGTLGGTSLVANATSLELDSGTFTLMNGRSEGPGTFIVSARADVAGGNTFTTHGPAEMTAGAQLGGGAGSFTTAGQFNIRGGTILTGGSVDVTGPGAVLNSFSMAGLMNVTGNIDHQNGSVSSSINQSPRINIRSNGVYAFSGDGTPFLGDGGDLLHIDAGGRLEKTGGAGVSSVNWTVNNSGAIRSTTGTLRFNRSLGGGGDLALHGGNVQLTGDHNLNGGTLSGTANLQFDSVSRTLGNDGLVAPGTSGPGALNIAANYQQAAGGALQIEIGGPDQGDQYDTLTVAGAVSLAGALNVTNINGFNPQTNQTFVILSAAGGVTGTFANTPGNVLTLANGDRYEVVYSAASVSLRNFVSANQPPAITNQPNSLVVHVGDPATFSVGVGGTGALAFQWRKNGNPIPGATNAVFNIAAAASSDAGSYSVGISNAVGAVISQAAQLIVLPAQSGVPVVGDGGLFGGNGSESGNGVFVDAAGNNYAVGGFSETMIVDASQEKDLTAAGGQDGFVIKFNSAGVCQWARRLGGTGDDEALAVAADAAGNVYVVGEFTSTNAMFGQQTLVAAGANDGFVVKLDANGQLQWVRQLSGPGDDAADDVVLGAGGAVYVAGSFDSTSLVIGTNSVTSNGGEDGFVAAFDAQGNTPWARAIGGSGTDELQAIARGPHGDLYAVGSFNSTDLSFGTNTVPNAGGEDVLVAKLAASGELRWLRGLGGSGMDQGLGIAVSDGGVVGIGGIFNSSNFVFSTNDTLASLGNVDGFIGGLTTNGVPQGANQIGGTGPDGVESVAVDGAGDFLAAGFVGSPTANLGTLQVGTFSARNGFVAKVSGSGTPRWIRGFGGAGSEEVVDIATGSSLEILTIGESTSPNLVIGGVNFTNRGGIDVFLAGLTNDAVFFSAHPQNVSTNSGAALALSVSVVSALPVSYQWRHNGAHLSGQTGATLTRAGIGLNDSGAYDVEVTTSTGTIRSRAAQVSVDGQVRFGGVNLPQGLVSFADAVVARVDGTVRPDASRDDSNQVLGFADSGAPGTPFLSLGRGGSVTVQFTDNILTGSGDSDVDLWIFEVGSLVERMLVEVSADGTTFQSVGAVSGQPSGVDLDAFGFGFNHQFRFVRITDDPNEGSHSGVSPGADVDAIAAITSVAPDPLITVHPTNTSVTLSNAVSFTVVASGTQPLFYQWTRNGTPVPNATNAVLNLPAALAAQAGTYRVVVSNSVDQVTSQPAVLTVNISPTILAQPQSASVPLGTAVSFSVTAAGTAPLTYQWSRNGAPLPGETNSILGILSAGQAQAGQYSVRVSNLAGQVLSDPATLTVIVPPSITTQPLSQTVQRGANVNLLVVAAGSPPIQAQWFKDGAPLPGRTNLTLSLTNVSFADSGAYRLGLTNVAGTVLSGIANVSVVELPIITEQPQSRVAREGATVLFRVQATNATHFQWRRNGVNLAGETNRLLTLTRVPTNAAGIYSVRVSNATTNLVSSNAVLTVEGAAVISEVGSWPDAPRGETFDVFATNGFIYTASGGAGLRIFSLTNGNSLVSLGTVDTPGSATALYVRGDTAFVADGEAGLAIIDVSDPFHPELLGSLDTPDFAQDVFPGGNHVFIADLEAGVQVINASNPRVPTLVATYDTPARAEGLFLAGSRLYIADMLAGLHILDVSNPASPTHLGTYDTAGAARSVEVIGNTAYVADWTAGLAVLNVADASMPILLGTIGLPGEAYDLKVFGTNAYVADFSSGLRVVNVSNPSSPSLRGTFDTAGFAIGVDAHAGMAFVADWTGGLQVVDVSQPTPMAITGVTAQGSSWDVTVEGQRAFVADFDAGLQILDVSDVTKPTQVGQLDTAGLSVGVDVENQFAYVADYDRGLLIVDVSDPAAPIQLGDYNTDGFARDVDVENGIAYVADDHAGLQIINVANANSPVRIGRIDTPDQAYAVDIENQVAYVADLRGGLQIIDVSNPAAPRRLSSPTNTTTTEAWDVDVDGSIAYVAAGRAGLKIFDVSQPANPTLLGTFDTDGDAVGIDVSGNLAAVADWNGGVIYVNVTNPRLPIPSGSFDRGKLAGRLEIVGDNIFVASRAHGLSIVNIPGGGGVVPLITAPPTNVVGQAGGTALLAATAAGSPVLLYQWQKDGVAIAGATNRALVLSNLGLADVGQYRLVVSNNFGSVISLPAFLNVSQPLTAGSVVFRSEGSQMQGGVMLLEFSRVDGREPVTGYRVQASHDLINWVTLTESPTATDGVLSVTDPSAGEQHCRFYRVIRADQ